MLISEVIEQVKHYCKGSWMGIKIDDEKTRDKILYGDPNQECTGIVTTIYASVDVIKKAHELQLETLLEVHSESELEYVGECIDMVGVNNRNLGTFHTDVANSYRLTSLLPKDYLLVSESGISNPQTVRELRQAGFRGFLIGETFMKTPDPGASLASFIAQVTQ